MPQDLPRALTGYAVMLAKVGRPDEAGRRAEARAVLAEAVRLYRDAATDNRAGQLPWLAQAVSNYALVLDDAEEAIAASAEAVELRRELVAGDRPAHVSGLADSLANQADRLRAVGRTEQAVAAGLEAVVLRREFAADQPAAGRGAFGWTLLVVAKWLTDAGRLDEGLALGEEAVAVAQGAFAAAGETHRELLAEALMDLSDRLELVPGRNKNRLRRIHALAARSVALSAVDAAPVLGRSEGVEDGSSSVD
jgi:tetratricopeptide (TPR) repeat protein